VGTACQREWSRARSRPEVGREGRSHEREGGGVVAGVGWESAQSGGEKAFSFFFPNFYFYFYILFLLNN
jgi:hypothetical protein